MEDLKQLARQIFHETLAAIDIPAAMQRKLRGEGSLLHCADATIDLRAFKKFRVVAIGKAAHAMLDGLRALLPPELQIEGIACAPALPNRPLPGIQYFVGGHPIPNAASWQAAEAILALLKKCDETTLVFFLLSGGGSALVELPLAPQMTLEDVQQFYRVLVTCGASISEMNAVRKHVSAVKGGRMALAAGHATKITLAVTDVPAGQESALASGPTFLFHPAHRVSEAKGFFTCCDNTTDDWPVVKAAEYLLAQLAWLRAANPGRRVALIADGEVSSPVTGKGVGGRNAAFVLACVENIVGQRVAVLSAGTDGIDGNSPAAGAVADGETLGRAMAAALKPDDSFQRGDAYTFFARLDDAIVTGPTGNNLRDLRILLAEP